MTARMDTEALAGSSTTYRLEWMAAARFSCHPKPMKGVANFETAKAAADFFARQAADARFISLTEITIHTRPVELPATAQGDRA